MNIIPSTARMADSLLFVFRQLEPEKFKTERGACAECKGWGHGFTKGSDGRKKRGYNCKACRGSGWAIAKSTNRE